MTTSILFSIGPLNIPTFGAFLSLGFLIASFIFFRNTKDELANTDQSIKLIIYAVVSWLIGARLIFFLVHYKNFISIGNIIFPWRYPGLSLTGGILGIAIAVYIITRTTSLDLWRLSDLSFLPLFVYNLAFFAGRFFSNQQPFSLYCLITTVVITIIGYWLLHHYRSLTWYPSGKTGLTLLSTNVFFFLAIDMLTIFPNDLSLVEVGINLTLAAVAVMIGYRRSGREVQKDFQPLIKLIKLISGHSYEKKDVT